MIAAEALIQLIQQYGVLAVIFGVFIEEIFVPMPSPVVPMAAGFIVVQASTLPSALLQIVFLIVIPASLASAVSSYFVYFLAYFGGKPVIKKYGGLLDVSWEEAKRMEEHFTSGKEHYYVALFRAVPVVPLSLISGSAGLFRMNWKTYGIWTLIGMVPRTFSLALAGWYLRGSFLQAAAYIDSISTLVMILAAATVAAGFFYRRYGDIYKKILFSDRVNSLLERL
ncbi:MAG: DedA family protein [Candidatus Nanohalobium sp.]